jgi:rRNA maturation RNase YbeY
MIQVSCDCDPSLDMPRTSALETMVTNVLNGKSIDNGKISFIFGTDELLADLKKKYFHKDQFTDVIAFRLNEYNEPNVEGEIYISLSRAHDNARIFNEPYEKEVSRLIIHGCLHLMGFNDESKKEKKEMTNLENRFLNQISWESLFKK